MKGWLAVLLLLSFALGGCAAPFDASPPLPSSQRVWISEEWHLVDGDTRAWYEDGAFRFEAPGDSIGFAFTADEAISFDSLHLEIEAVFPADRGNELLAGVTFWNLDSGERLDYLWTLRNDEYVSVGARAAGGNLVTVRDVQYLFIPEPSMHMVLQTSEPYEIPAGRWGLLAGGAPFESVKVSFNLPPGAAADPVVAAQSGCRLVQPAEFDAMLAVVPATGPKIMLDAFIDLEMADGLQAYLYGGEAGSARLRILLPDGSIQEGEFGPLDAAELRAFIVDHPGRYQVRIDHSVGGIGAVVLGVCNVPGL